MPTASGYRADIDGLRAIAVLAVVIFHAFPAALPGGFVGVDVFFVISGYLISGILLKQINENRLDPGTFYARRVKRLFPALIAVLMVSLALGWWILFPEELRLLGRHSAAGAGFVSNLQLLSESGYFDMSAQSKPLLHLWSLGVEEQFYFALPLLIVLAGRRLRVIVWSAPVIFVASFAFNLWYTEYSPSTAFFLPVTRFWEFLAGSGLAWLAVEHKPRIGGWASITGLAVIAGSMGFLDETRAFPGWWALLPALGTFLVIAAGPDAWLNRVLLSRPLLVGIGLISYPLYLWHWPLLTFSRFIETGLSDAGTRIAAVILSGALAWLTWRYLERPARLSSGFSMTAGLCSAMAALAVIGFCIFNGNGYPQRFPASLETIKVGADLAPFTHFECGISSDDRRFTKECQSDIRETPVLAVVGDSHASALYPGLVRESRPGHRWMLIGRPGCAPVTGVVRIEELPGDDASDCANSNSIITSALAQNPRIETVMIAISSRMSGTLNQQLSEGVIPRYSGRFADGMSNTIDTLERAGKAVFFLVDNPPLPGPNLCLPMKHFGLTRKVHDGCSVSKEVLAHELNAYRLMIQELQSRHPAMRVIDPTGVLCEESACNSEREGKSLYSYTDHLSDYGNSLVARVVMPQ